MSDKIKYNMTDENVTVFVSYASSLTLSPKSPLSPVGPGRPGSPIAPLIPCYSQHSIFIITTLNKFTERMLTLRSPSGELMYTLTLQEMFWIVFTNQQTF